MEAKGSGLYSIDEDALKARNTDNEIFFNFSYAALKLLGKNLYNNAATAISELVANSIDAKAPQVYVYIDMSDKAHSTIEILDNGSGMDYSDLAQKYVWIGRNKRTDDGLSQKERDTIMGRKGIGKLAALYLSNRYYILTKKEGYLSEETWEVNLSMYMDSDYPKLDRVTSVIPFVNRQIWNGFAHGTAIILTDVDLRRNGATRIESLRRVFADYYLLDSINSKIYVAVRDRNNPQISFSPVEKKIAYKNFYAIFDNSGNNIRSKMSDAINFTWLSKYEHIQNKPRPTQFLNLDHFKTTGTGIFHIDEDTTIVKDYQLSGWIAIHSTIEQRHALDKDFLRNNIYQPNRLRLYVRNKLAVDDYFNISPSTQAMANYIEGEISFDILDDDDLPDIATSSRQDFLEDERIELLISLVNPILSALFQLRNKIGSIISKENWEFEEEQRRIEEEKRQKEAEARAKAEEEAKQAEKARADAIALAEREQKRSKYILEISGVEDKNILNTVHDIYNMSCRVKENLDALSSFVTSSLAGKKKLEKAVVSNQRILSVSKLITKTGRVVDDNDALKSVVLAEFVTEYANNVLRPIYEKDIRILCEGDVSSTFSLKIKALSFIMMMDNIIGNAIKAKSKDMHIIFDDSDPSEFRIIFRDNGNGIDDALDIDSLFEFGVTTTNGSGLGLYYARKQMKNLDGTIGLYRNDDCGASVVLCWKK